VRDENFHGGKNHYLPSLVKKTRLEVTTSQTMAKKTAKNNSYNKLLSTILELDIKKKQQQQIGTI